VPTFKPQGNLSKTDMELITVAQEIKQNNKDVVIATRDRELSSFADTLEIKTIDFNQLQDLFSEDISYDENIKSKAKNILTAQTRTLISGIVIGVIANLLTTFIWMYFEVIVKTATIWGTILLIILTGISIYSLRGRFRLQYGIFEFLFGIVVATKPFWPNFDYSTVQSTDAIQILAGIYVMIRGQDNIGKAIINSRFESIWKIFSGEE